MDFFLGLVSAIIGLLLINWAALTVSMAWRSPAGDFAPLEVRYLFAFAAIVLFMLNGNQLMSGAAFFPIFTFCLVFLVLFFLKKNTSDDRRRLRFDVWSISFVQLIFLFFVVVQFDGYKYWLLEGYNHDSIIYHYGSQWANEYRMFVGSEAVWAKWGFDTWIGFDKSLYRGGTYTLAAWVQFFSPRSTGNALYYLVAYAGAFAWLAVKVLLRGANGSVANMLSVVLAVLLGLSTAMVGALINSNLATLIGAASFCVVFALALRADLLLETRYAAMAAWCAIGTHFYAESIFYAALLVFIVFAVELKTIVRARGWIGAVRLGLGVLAIVVVLGNVAFGQSVSSLFLFSSIAKGGEWSSWYMHQPPLVWVGSFVAGLLVGEAPSQSMVWLSALTTGFAFLILLRSRQHRGAAIALLLVSCLAVSYVVVNSYQYGEHKILQLLGPAWSLSIVAAFISLIRADRRLISGRSFLESKSFMGMALLACISVVTAQFLIKSGDLLDRMTGVHSLDFGISEVAKFARPGDAVLLDDVEWSGVEKFLKTHYVAFELLKQGAKVLLPNIDDNGLRGGYLRGVLSNTFQQADQPHWLLSGNGQARIQKKFVGNYDAPVWQNKDFRLYRVYKKPVVVTAGGFHDCEPSHCWTRGAFELEVFVPAAGTYQLVIDFWPLVPTKTNLLTVRRNDGGELAKVNGSDNRMNISVPAGWSRLTFDPAAQVVSPQELGISADSRKLFVALRRVEFVELKVGGD